MTESPLNTHKVENQSPIFGGHNTFTGDPLLGQISSSLSPAVIKDLTAHGAWGGSTEAIALGALANTKQPELQTFDGKGNRIDQVEFHPSYHALMRRSTSVGLHCSVWEDVSAERDNRNLIRAARVFMMSQVESGHLCPITMTNASVAALSKSPELSKEWVPLIKSRKYDQSNKSPAKKAGLTIGMGMTEKQGGSDIRSNTSVATPLQNGIWSLTGHKWFFSAPMCDAFIMLAQTAKGLSCFLVPRVLPDGKLNGLQLQRLKDKMGNRSNASSEVEFAGALGQIVGEEGDGIATILEMVTLTRLDCTIGSAGIMRTALAEAVHHTRFRNVSGRPLIEQPMMQRVLADVSLDVAASTALSMRLAKAYDAAANSEVDAAYARLMTPVIKYWVCKQTPAVTYEAMECLGGNGYVETGNLARHYREAPLNGIWEGSGNIMCLDVLRVIGKHPQLLDAVLQQLESDLGGEGAKKTVEVIHSAAQMASQDPGSARILTEQLAMTAAAAELNRLGMPDIAGAFIETRLGGLWRTTYGMLDNRYNAGAIVNALYPEG